MPCHCLGKGTKEDSYLLASAVERHFMSLTNNQRFPLFFSRRSMGSALVAPNSTARWA